MRRAAIDHDECEVRLLRALAAAMSAGLSPERFLRVFSDELAQWVAHHHVDVELLSEDGSTFGYLGASFRDGPYAVDGDGALWNGFANGVRYPLEHWTIRHSVHDGQPRRFDDYPNDPLVLETDNALELATMRGGLRYGLILPLKANGIVFGVMCCGRGLPYGPFDDDEFQLAATLAARLAPFVQTFRSLLLEQETRAQLQRQRDLQQRLNAISSAVAGSVDERSVLSTFASELVKAIPCAGLEVRLVSGPTTCRSFSAHPDAGWADLGEQLTATAPGAACLLTDATHVVEGSAPTVLTVPLRARSRRIGSLTFRGGDDLAGESTRVVAFLLADHLGPYLESVRLAREAESRAREVGANAERSRMAREMHDRVIDDLSAARRVVERDEATDRLEPLIDGALRGMRELVWELRSTPVPPEQLESLLEAQLEIVGEELGAAVELARPVDVGRLDAAQSTALHAVARQLLSNARRHSAAHRVTVRLTSAGGRCRLVVRDDGIGMTPGVREHRPQADGGGAGLFLVREQVRQAGGELVLRSAPGRGTEIDVSLPLTRPDGALAPLLAAFADTEPLRVEPLGEAPVRVLVVDHQTVVREGLRALVDRAPDLCVVGEAGDHATAIRLARTLQPRIVLLDLHLPVRAAEVARSIVREAPNARLIGTTSLADAAAARAMLDAGVDGLVSKAAGGDQLLEAVRRCALAEATPEPGAVSLTGREAEVLDLLHTDLTYREIGERLCLSAKTVQYHVNHLFAKLDVHSRAAAVARAGDLGLSGR